MSRRLSEGITRRQFACASVALAYTDVAGALVTTDRSVSGMENRLKKLESTLGARVGVWIADTQTRQTWSYRAIERFPVCGIYKLVACAALLSRADEGKVDLNHAVRFSKADLVAGSPVTQARLDQGSLTLAQLCEAALTQNDHTAGNLILHRVGGPEGANAFMSYQGDAVSRIDSDSPSVSAATPGDPRNTTTPKAMGEHLKAMLFGSTLSHPSRRLLTSWLLENNLATAGLRSRLPRGWDVGEKFAVGSHGTFNSIAVVWPRNHKPLVVSIFITGTRAPLEKRFQAAAEVGSYLPALVA